LQAGFWWGDTREGDHSEDLTIDGRTILKWVCRKQDGEGWTGLIWLRIGAGGGIFECGNEPSGSVICGEFIDYLRTC
jgi:hypothetical protein